MINQFLPICKIQLETRMDLTMLVKSWVNLALRKKKRRQRKTKCIFVNSFVPMKYACLAEVFYLRLLLKHFC